MARTWSVAVSVAAVDVSALVFGTTKVVAEENQARTASFSYLPSGSYVPETWIGAAVLIDHIADPDDGATATRIFTGACNWPVLDETTGVVTLECSDMIQDDFEALTTDAAILAVVTGGKLQDEVFGDREDGWQRTQDALSTVRKELHKSNAGTITLTDWAAKGTGDYPYTLTGVLHRSPSVTFAQKRELVNTVEITYQYRFSRFKIRSHAFTWAGYDSGFAGDTYCDWVADGNPYLPKSTQFISAADGAGWNLHGAIAFGRLPEPGAYVCDGNPIVWLGAREEDSGDSDTTAQGEALDVLVMGASWTVRKPWVQSITEEYTITAACADSVSMFGSAPGEDGASFDVEADDAGQESSENTDIPAGYAQDAINDWVEDQGDRATSDDVIECLLQVADARIAASHRRNYVEWQVPIEPGLDLEHTAQITAGNVVAKGKVFQFQHTLNLDSGEAITGIKIACSRGGAGSTDALTAPTPPSTAPTHGAPPGSTSMTTYVGGDPTSDDWVDGDHDGESYVSTNQQDQTGVTGLPDKVYPRRVQIVGPAVEVEARDSVDAPATAAYAIGVPDDTLTVSL